MPLAGLSMLILISASVVSTASPPVRTACALSIRSRRRRTNAISAVKPICRLKLPACVEACPTKALTFGNLDDPNSEISQLLRQKPTYRYKLALGTKPKLYRVPFKYGEVSQ